MRLENSPISVSQTILSGGLGVLLALLLPTSATAEEPQESLALQGSSRAGRRAAPLSQEAAFSKLRATAVLAQSLKSAEPGKVAQIESAIAPVLGNLSQYPNLSRVHSHEEPLWLVDRGELTAQAVLALSALERLSPSVERRENLEKLATGLAYLQRKERVEYPFGAHVSWRDAEPLAQLGDGTTAPTAYFRTDRAYTVQALAEAGQVLNKPRLLESAQREALGMATHLIIHGELVASFSPQPKKAQSVQEALPMVAGFVALYQATGNKVYSDLAALATRWLEPRQSLSGPEWEKLKRILSASPSSDLLTARSSANPVTFQYIEAEEGKVVNKAIDTLDYESSSGQPGRLAVMGRENTFWMRFDVPTEDDYLFDLSYLQSDVGGGLVSVMMRIDGDKIFQVPLGDVDGKPILRRKYVDGPRPLRSGPHSFGIRFSGLLMTKPALLDSVVVQPALERREFTLANGERLYLLRNATAETAKTDKQHFASWPPVSQLVVDGNGAPAKLGTAEDRRRRKQFVTLPPFGVALLRVKPNKPNLE